MKTTGQYFPVVLFIVLYKVVQTCEFVHEILKKSFAALPPFYKFNMILTRTRTCQI